MLAKDIMVREVVTAKPEDKVRDVLQLMALKRISGLPVVDGQSRLLGIVTDSDIVSRIRANRPVFIDLLTEVFILDDTSKLGEKVAGLAELSVSQVMTKKVIAVSEDAEVDEIAGIMADRKIKKIPVVEGGILKGLISRGDIIRAVAGQSLSVSEADQKSN